MRTATPLARLPAHVRDLVLLTLLALAARAVAALVVDYPPYTDPAYYTLVAQRLADGHGFTVPVLWSFLEVGSVIPRDTGLPVPSNRHWMPLTSIVSAGSMALFGSTWRAGQLPMVFLSTALVPLTYLVGWQVWRSRWVAVVAGMLAVFAGPLLIMYPTIDNFAVFGVAGCACLYASSRATVSSRPGRWLVFAGAAAGLATLARVDGVLLLLAPATAWLMASEWRPWSAGARRMAAARAIGFMGPFAAVISPWLARNVAVFGRPFPSAGGHTLWITSYNEQFSIGREVTLERYLDWGWANIVASKLDAWYQLLGRTGVLLGGVFLFFFLAGLWMHRHRRELAPFHVYFIAMFGAMGAVFTFHAPHGAFYHSAPAWLPFALPLAVASVAPVCTASARVWPFLRRPATHRFITVAATAGAIALSIAGSSLLYIQWSGSRARDETAGRFFIERGLQDEVVMYGDAVSLHHVSANPGVAAPFDPYPVLERVVRAYDVRWVVVTLADGASVDPLGLWNGAASVDRYGNRAHWLAETPALDAPGVRIYEVRPSTIGSP